MNLYPTVNTTLILSNRPELSGENKDYLYVLSFKLRLKI